MIPTKLRLSNFTSYGSAVQELDFTKFHLAAISGSNGAGKSSLLDAITWCVWGSSRLGDSSDALIRLGQNEMWVEFSFQLDSHPFTIKRKRLSKSGGSTSLELVSSSHNLTEGTIKATQQKIVDLLHLTYETFVNSAFIRQGHADEFTTKGATDRKRILADILGLSGYDALEEQAKEKSKELQTKLQLLEYQLLEIEAELSQKDERQKRLSETEKEAQAAEERLKTVETEIRAVEGEREVIAVKRQALLEKQQQAQAIQQELTDIKLQIELKETAQQEYQTILNQKSEIEKNYLVLQDLSKQKATLEVKRSGLIKAKDEWAVLLKVVNEREEKRLRAINDLKIQKEQLQAVSDKLQSEVDHLKAHRDNCPTCGQEIDIKKNKEITTKHRGVITENRKAITELESKIVKYQSHVIEEQAQADQKEKQVQVLEQETKTYTQINQQVLSLEKYNEAYSKLQQAETTVKAQLEAITDLKKIHQNKEKQVQDLSIILDQLKELEIKLLEVKNKVEAQMIVKQELAGKALTLRSQVGEARQLVSRAEQLEKLAEGKQTEKNLLQKERAIFEELALAFGKKGIQAMIIETVIPEIEEETNRLLDRLTEGRMRVALVTQKETKTKVAGTGEKGLVETLDIVISDEMGERPYEAYSVDGSELVYIKQNGQIRVVPIQEMWGESTPVINNGEYQFQESTVEALCYVNGQAIWQKVDQILRHKSPDKILEVTCGPGNYTVKLTKNHSVYVMTCDGLKIKRTEDLRAGDFLLSPKDIPEQQRAVDRIDFTDFISENFIQKRKMNHKPLRWDDDMIWSRRDQTIKRVSHLNSDLARLVGIIVAEGSGQLAYSVAVGTDSKLAKEVIRLSSQIFGLNPRTLGRIPGQAIKKYIEKYPGVSSLNPKTQFNPKIGGRLIAHMLKNMVGEKASFKRIPGFIFNSSRETKLAFLSGIIAGDGHIQSDPKHSKSEVAITTVSHRLAGELIFLYRQLGIWARLEKHGETGFRRGMNHQKSYRVVASGKKNLETLGLGQIVSTYDNVNKYEGIPYSLVGNSRKQQTGYSKRFPRNSAGELFSCNVRKIPKSSTDKYLQIQELAGGWNILEIRNIQEVEPISKYVYDLMVPGNNSFVAGNGAILVHNSGGEQFRVNLAIRLALSRLLTNRAGSKLQFLVVDEGFGTQDTQGISRIVEALNAIQDEFEKVVVITHLDELKEEFPTRIEVAKGPTGSTFQVVGI